MFDKYVIEDSLAEFWLGLRWTPLNHSLIAELEYLKENGLGLKLYVYAALPGKGYCDRTAIVCTPDDIKNLKV